MATGTSIVLQILTLISIILPLANSIEFNFPAVFNFGDSNSDTGDLVSGGFESLGPPYGQAYFKNPSGRYSDGRLVIDFLSKFLRHHMMKFWLQIQLASFLDFKKGFTCCLCFPYDDFHPKIIYF